MRLFLRFICVIFCFSVTSIAQNQYEDYESSEIVFMDDFSNNKNGWTTGISADSCYNSKIENGAFDITSTCNGTHPMYWITQTIDIQRDFEIEAELRYVQGEDNNAQNLMWGKDDNSYRFNFGISGYGQYVIRQYNGSWITLKDWKTSDLIHKSDYNKLTVRKIGARYYFFLNEQFVHTSDFFPFFGNQMGFQGNQNSTMRVHYLKVSYLESKPNPDLAKIHQNGEEELSNFFGSFGLGYIHSIGEIRDLWEDGFDFDILIGYWLIPNFGFECGFNGALIGIAEDKKITVGAVDNYGNHSNQTTSGGFYGSLPVGLKFSFPISSGSKVFCTIGGGGDYYFANEIMDITDYNDRGTSGFGYYAKISFSWLDKENKIDNRGLGWGFQIRYIMNNADVSEFYPNTPGLISKSHSRDARLVLLLELCKF